MVAGNNVVSAMIAFVVAYSLRESISGYRRIPSTVEPSATDLTTAFAKDWTVTGRSTKGKPSLLPTKKAPTGA